MNALSHPRRVMIYEMLAEEGEGLSLGQPGSEGLQLGGGRQVGDGQGAGGGREDTGQEAQERALPLTAFPPEQYGFPGLQAQVQRVEGGRCSPGPAKA